MLNFVLFSYISQIIFFGCAWCRSDINFHSLHKRYFIVLEKSSLKHLWNKNSWESSSCCCILVSSVQFSSQSYPTLCNPIDCSTPVFPVHQQLPGLAQTHVHQVDDASQSSHPLSSPSPPANNLSHHQNLLHHAPAKFLFFLFFLFNYFLKESELRPRTYLLIKKSNSTLFKSLKLSIH